MFGLGIRGYTGAGAAVVLLVVGGWGGWKTRGVTDGVKIHKAYAAAAAADQRLAGVVRDLDVARQNHSECVAALEDQDAAVKKWQGEATEWRSSLAAAIERNRQLATNLAAAHAVVQGPPLPEDCEEAVREALRRLQVVTP